jgi:signal peptidase I
MTQHVRRYATVWLLAGVAACLLTSGCGASAVEIANDARASSGNGLLSRSEQSVVYRVPSASMEPTLAIGARVVVQAGRPRVGAIVVFHPPEGSLQRRCGSQSHVLRLGRAACDTVGAERSKAELIKRIVAGPGDEIYVREGHVFRKASGSGSFVRERDAYSRACAGGLGCNFPVPIKIPAGQWFLMGDNRGASDDSRFWGPVPTAWLVGFVTGATRGAPVARTTRQSERLSFQDLAVAKVAACLRRAGVEIPHSGAALLSSTSGIQTRSPEIKAAIGKCRRGV